MQKKILIVDDSATIRNQLTSTLAPAGYQLVEAGDGIEGLQRVQSEPDISLAICDVNMPRMDGIEMITKLSEEGVKFPIVMLTTEGQAAMIQKAKAAGARGWIVKPFNPSQLIKVVQKLAV